MEVRVHAERCQGHTMCNIAQPDIFKLDTVDGHAFITDPRVPPGAEAAVLSAQASCPEYAIEVTDDVG